MDTKKMVKMPVAGLAWLAKTLSDWCGELSKCITKSAVERDGIKSEENLREGEMR